MVTKDLSDSAFCDVPPGRRDLSDAAYERAAAAKQAVTAQDPGLAADMLTDSVLVRVPWSGEMPNQA